MLYDCVETIWEIAKARGLDPATDVLSAGVDDLSVPSPPPEFRTSRWRRRRGPSRASIHGFYGWAVDAGLLPGPPVRKLRNGRDALSWGPRTELDVRHLTFRQRRHLHRVGLGRLARPGRRRLGGRRRRGFAAGPAEMLGVDLDAPLLFRGWS
jgi:hypothetical protein